MQVISEEKINEIRNTSDIVEIISNYIPLEAHGKNYFGICPFHDDHSPSMSVSREKQLYKCFVCNKGGNVFNFVKDYENISYIEAVKKVADMVGIDLDISNIKHEKKENKKEYEIMEFATNIFQNSLNTKEGALAKKYLEERNIDENIIKEFRIGLSLNDKTYLTNIMLKKYDANILDELGLIYRSGIDNYDKFISRIMIPICNENGFVVGFTGRIYEKSDSAKYINTKETSIYKKGNILFNYHLAKNYVREEKSIIVVEGNMDAIRMYSSGVKNVIALMGTVITKEQVNLLKKLRVPVILMLDNDDAGKSATITVGDFMQNEGLECMVVRLEGAKDPDEYIVKYGVDNFRKTLSNANKYLDYKMIYLKENLNLNNTDDLITYLRSVIKLISDKDNLTKEVTLKKLSEEYNVDYEVLKREANFTKEDIKVQEKVEKKKLTIYDKCVTTILYYLMSDSKYLPIYKANLGYLKNKNERELVREIEHYIQKYGKINCADFLSYAENNDNIRDLVHTITESIENIEIDDKIFMDYLKKANCIIMKDDINTLKVMLKNTDDEVKKIDIMKQIRDIKKRGVSNNGRD